MLNELKSLKIFNRIKFHDDGHKYFVDGKKVPKSITGVISDCKKKFDSEKWSLHCAKKQKKDKDTILKEWKDNADFSTQLGTLLHTYVENFLSNKIKKYEQAPIIERFGTDKHDEMRILLAKFIHSFHSVYQNLDHLIHIKTEMIVGDVDDTCICGTIDLLTFNTQKKCFEIYDYKTNKKFTYKNDYNEKFTHPEISHLDVCDLTSYSLQQSFYKYLIHKYTDVRIGDCYIIWFNRTDGSCELIKCLDLTQYCENILKTST